MNDYAMKAVQDKPVMPCDEAYTALRNSQSSAMDALNILADRLGAVLSPEAPVGANGASPVAVPPPPASELHGRLIAAAERTDEIERYVRSLTCRLTV